MTYSKFHSETLSQTPCLHNQVPNKGLHHLLSQLKNCTSLDEICRFHSQIFKTKFHNNVFLLTRLAHAYLRFNHIYSGKRILMNMIENPPVFLWNETIKGFARNGCFKESIEIYKEMVEAGYKPNEFTFTFVLPACAGLKSESSVRKVHDDVVSRRCESNVFVATALVDMYVKCGDLRMGRKVFDEMLHRGTASYNAMIARRRQLSEPILRRAPDNRVIGVMKELNGSRRRFSL